MPPPGSYPLRRRPRVAGRRHPADRPAQPAERGTSPGAVAVADPPATEAPSATAQPRRHRVVAPAAVIPAALIAVLVIALSLAVWFRGEAKALGNAVVTSNRAVLDVGATAQLTGQVREGVERVFSYDFARLDDNERAANAVITGSFARDYPRQFARVRELAPGQQAVVVATVPALAVKVLDGDRAIVVVFIDQQANRAGQAAPLLAAGRLRVTAQRVGGITGSWKLADVQPF